MGSEGVKTVDTQPERIEEKTQVEGKLDKFETFINGPHFSALPQEEKDRVTTQYEHLKGYATALKERIAAVI